MLCSVPIVNTELFAVVDVDDFQKVSRHRWYVRHRARNTHARTKIDGKTVYLHRFIMNAPNDKHVDHIDSNGLNNSKANLRLCSPTENQHNQRTHLRNAKSQYKGVSKDQKSNWVTKWRARIQVDGKRLSLGHFATEEDAARAYNAAATEMFGEFARLNEF